MNDTTPGQSNAFIFGMNGRKGPIKGPNRDYGTQSIWPNSQYCVQIFKDGPTIDAQWPKFGPTHGGMSFAANPPYTSCVGLGDNPAPAGATKIKNPVLADGTIVKAGAWFKY